MSDKKKKLGQFYTNELVADFMAGLVIRGDTQSVLDPAVGPGVFISSCNKLKKEIKYTAYDVDLALIKECEIRNNECAVDYRNRDYLAAYTDEKYDAIICNPPYLKFQDIEGRKTYIDEYAERFGLRISGYSNLCVYFLIKSLNELKEKGRCCFIMPYEFLNTGYGEVIKEYILKNGSLRRIFKFSSDAELFDDAVTTSCIMYFEKSEEDIVEFISVKSVKELISGAFSNVLSYSLKELIPGEKWNNYFYKTKGADNNMLPFSSIAKVKRGIATGNNEYFALSQRMIKERGLSEKAAVKCICKSRDVKTLIFNEAAFEKLKAGDKKVFLFDGTKAECKGDYDYIQMGLMKGIDKTYLNSHRNPWYALEKKDAAPIWVSVFNRDGIKYIRNETGAKNLTTFHGIYLNKEYQDYTNILFCYLLTPLSQEIFMRNKREYAKGLDKFEPNDLNNAYVLNLKALSQEDKRTVNEMYRQLSLGKDSEEIIRRLNELFAKYFEMK